MRLASWLLTLAVSSTLPAVVRADEIPPDAGMDSRSTGQSPQVVEVQGDAARTTEASVADGPPAPMDEEQARAEERRAREERERLRELEHEDDRDGDLDRRQDEGSDARSFDIFWGGPEIGMSFIDLKMIEYDDLLPQQVDVSDSGFAFGATIGVKVKILAAGLHLAVGQFSDFDVWIVDLDGQLRIPLGPVEPYLRLAIGYAFLGSFQGPDLGGADVDGWNLTGGFGLDIYPSDYFSIGAGADFSVLNLTRSGGVTEVDLTQDGGAVGLAVWLQARAAVHF